MVKPEYHIFQGDGNGWTNRKSLETSFPPTKRFYKPFLIRIFFLSFFCVVTLAIFTLLALAASKYPTRVQDSHTSYSLRAKRRAIPLPLTTYISDSLIDGSSSSSSSSSSSNLPIDGILPSLQPQGNPGLTAYTNFTATSSVVVTGAPAPTVFTNFTNTRSLIQTTIGVSEPNTSVIPTTSTTAPPDTVFSVFGRFTTGQYFLGAYFPTLVAVLYGILWELPFTRIREMEPFFQLSKPSGASASNSLCLNYSSSGLYSTIYQSFVRGHFAVFGAAVVSLIISISTMLASEVLFIGTTGKCISTGNGNDCIPYLALRPSLAKVEAALGSLVFCIVALITLYLWNRRSGIYSEATSIAGIGVLLQDPAVLRELRGILPGTSMTDIQKRLKGKTYKLSSWTDYRIIGDYGIADTTAVVAPIHYLHDTDDYPIRPPGLAEVPHRGWLRKKKIDSITLSLGSLFLFWLFLAGLMILILYYRFVGTLTGFEKFMDSQSIGVRFLFTAVGVLIRGYWGLIDSKLRQLAPFYRLSKGTSSSRTATYTILLPSSAHPITAVFSSLLHGQVFIASISFVAVCSEVLIVTLSGIPFSSAQSYKAYLVSTWVSTAILGLMLVALVGVAIWVRVVKGLGAAGMYPGSLMALLLYLSASPSLLASLKGLSVLEGKERDNRITGMGRVYRFGEVMGDDGIVRLGVDFDDVGAEVED